MRIDGRHPSLEAWQSAVDAALKEIILGGPCEDKARAKLRACGLTDGEIDNWITRKTFIVRAREG